MKGLRVLSAKGRRIVFCRACDRRSNAVLELRSSLEYRKNAMLGVHIVCNTFSGRRGFGGFSLLLHPCRRVRFNLVFRFPIDITTHDSLPNTCDPTNSQRAANESLPVMSERWRVSLIAKTRMLFRPRISKRLTPQFEVISHGVCLVSRRIAPIRWSVMKQIAPV